MLIGYILAFIASIFFTLYIIPKKISKQSPLEYIYFMGIGFFVTGVIMLIAHYLLSDNPESFYSPYLFAGALNGILYTTGFILFFTAIDKIGMSKTNQWKNIQGPVGATLMLILFAEFLTTNFIYIILAIIFIFISASLFTVKDENEIKIDSKYIIYPIISGIFFGTSAFLQKYLIIHGFLYTGQLYNSLFVLITIIIYLIFTKTKINKITDPDSLLGILGGIILYFTFYLYIISLRYIEGSISYMIAQLNAVWTVIVGIIIFKEINFKKHYLRIIIGIMFAILGIIMLLFAQK